MSESPHEQKREFYRLRYPAAERPRLRIGDKCFDVSEVSEEGARIVVSGSLGPGNAMSFAGTITFRSDVTENVEGTVLRTDDNEVVVNLTNGISLKTMMAEQQRLRQKFSPVADKSKDG